MKLVKKSFLSLCFFITGFSYGAVLNQQAPSFTLKDSMGKEQRLSDYKGKTVVLEWLNFGCPFVKKHYSSNNMQKLQKKYKEKGVVWLSVVSSAPGKQGYYSGDEMNNIAKQNGLLASAILLDPSGQVGKSYGAKTTPHMFIINSNQELVYMGAIDSVNSADPADIPKAKNYIEKALDELLAGKKISTARTKAYGCSVKYAD